MSLAKECDELMKKTAKLVEESRRVVLLCRFTRMGYDAARAASQAPNTCVELLQGSFPSRVRPPR
jgi:hypothetical protein